MTMRSFLGAQKGGSRTYLSDKNGAVDDEHVDVRQSSHENHAFASTIGRKIVASVIIVPKHEISTKV